MADGTKIEWTDATWNPITGCSVVSPGCTNCYAMKLAGGRLSPHPSRAGLTRDTKAGPVWTGEVRFNEAWLDQPLRWSRPRMIFVCGHGDLFAEGVPDAWIDRVFAVMALAPRHTFQVLTKRAERMRAYLSAPNVLEHVILEMERLLWSRKLVVQSDTPWPLPNVWAGVSAEDQRRADERVPLLLKTPAEVRWVSAEPLLGPIDFRPWLFGEEEAGMVGNCIGYTPPLDWIVAGGESGIGSRPMHPDWIRGIRDHCAEYRVPFLFKQWGSWMPLTPSHGNWPADEANFCRLRVDGTRGDDGWSMQRVGKKHSGRVLFGSLHDGYPEAAEVPFG